jgi:hypothetical protein
MSGVFVSLPDDHEFIATMISIARSRGVMTNPTFEPVGYKLVEGPLQLDLLNVWHELRGRTAPEADAVIDCWIAPKHLAQACYFGRVDLVEKAIKAGVPLDVAGRGENPIATAFTAIVATPLHLKCIELLFAAGAKATLGQFEKHQKESTGTAVEFSMRQLLVENALKSEDPAVREAGERLKSPTGLPRL